MSHNTTVDNVLIKDLDCLKQAISRLKESGVNIELDTKSKRFRTWGGQDPRCDIAINLPGEQFDVGLVLKDGAYAPRFDHMLSGNHSIACPVDAGERHSNRHTIGRLMQEYTRAVTSKELILQGASVTERRETNGDLVLVAELIA